ncbi:MAG TPA: HD domain-containing phosphohydrolase [Solimonas sp.]|nr:HD domain-containing phosphohydrolase [Solimonas sp.]
MITPTGTVLVVDDTPQNLNVASRILREHYRCLVALDGMRCLEIANSEDRPDLILLDLMMPGLNGYETCKRLKDDPRTRDIPVIFLTAMNETDNEAAGFQVGAVDYIVKPIQPATMLARVRAHLSLYQHEQHLATLVQLRTAKLEEKTRELEQTRLEIIRRLGRAAEYKDDDTGLHVIRMSHYARLLAMSAGLPQDRCEVVFNAAPMHDIGKIGIPDVILQKPGPLTDEEWVVMRQHPAIGAGIIGKHNSELLELARVVALAHHERWNGQGYPRGRAGADIPIEARIVAIADVFDALTSKRPYKDEWPVEESADYIRRQSGQHFDPDLVPRFLELVPQFVEIKRQYTDL